MFITDASVAVKWFVEEPLHAQARRIFKFQRDIQAPDIILLEVANAAWKKTMRGEIRKQQMRDIIAVLPDYFPDLIPSAKVLARASELAIELEHPVYDCLYLACATGPDDVLVTADKRFFNKVKNARLSAQIHFLGDPDLALPL